MWDPEARLKAPVRSRGKTLVGVQGEKALEVLGLYGILSEKSLPKFVQFYVTPFSLPDQNGVHNPTVFYRVIFCKLGLLRYYSSLQHPLTTKLDLQVTMILKFPASYIATLWGRGSAILLAVFFCFHVFKLLSLFYFLKFGLVF